MTDDLAAFLRDRLNEDEQAAQAATPGPWAVDSETHAEAVHGVGSVDVVAGSRWGGEAAVFESTEDALHIARHDPARVLAEVDAKRRIVDAHEPEWTIVEWPDDQNGKGEAQVCRSCGNKDLDGWMNWRPAVGEAGAFPDGVQPPYIVAPCETLRLLALPYHDHPDYRPEWAPNA